MCLSNLNIAVTASRRAAELAQVIRSLGGKPYIAPTTGIKREERTPIDVSKFIELSKESKPDYVVFMTGPSVYSLIDLSSELGKKELLINILQSSILVARSPKTQMSLFIFGLKPILIPKSGLHVCWSVKTRRRYGSDEEENSNSLTWHLFSRFN